MQRFHSTQMWILIAIMAYMAFRSGGFASPMDWLMRQLYCLPGILIGLCFHEFGHAFVAYKLGDDTPKIQGRVTVNPVAHIDPVGFLALIFVGFGWGKPVEINPGNFKHRKRDEILVDIAGVTVNFVLAVIFAFVLRFYTGAMGYDASEFQWAIWTMIYYAVYINLILMVFNLLPIPPLDGFNLIVEIFNLRHTGFYRAVYDKGMLILMVLIIFNVISYIMSPCIRVLMNALYAITGAPLSFG